MDLSPDLVDDPMFEIIGRIPEFVRTELTDAQGPPVCFCGLWPGTQAPPFGIMDCDNGNCGISWTTLTAMYPSTAFPLPDDGTRFSKVKAMCEAPMAYQLDVGVARCAPRATGLQVLPDEQDTFNALRLYMSDERAVRRAITCQMPAWQREQNRLNGTNIEIRFLVGDWRPIENIGGVSGGIWKVWLGRDGL